MVSYNADNVKYRTTNGDGKNGFSIYRRGQFSKDGFCDLHAIDTLTGKERFLRIHADEWNYVISKKEGR